ncbi:hypothetical protein EVAR_56909_1 [Eumeta japonica]|uniref:Uncharacterized protein n=1 Tax=Eumeta variegata TaxID=151549 RepID=A0A4C1YDK6_EUMVA|nr:hypothetical protein EVAR_56909_1 [Eumeta japonica]
MDSASVRTRSLAANRTVSAGRRRAESDHPAARRPHGASLPRAAADGELGRFKRPRSDHVQSEPINTRFGFEETSRRDFIAKIMYYRNEVTDERGRHLERADTTRRPTSALIAFRP